MRDPEALPSPPAHAASIACRFTRGYVEAALFSGLGEDETPPGGLDAGDLAPETWAAVRRDCAAFLAACGDLVDALGDHHRPGSPNDDAMSHAGRDFWYTREGHGCGFWDGDWPEASGEALSSAAKAFGEASWYVGDDGRIWQSGDETPRPASALPPVPIPPPESFPRPNASAPGP